MPVLCGLDAQLLHTPEGLPRAVDAGLSSSCATSVKQAHSDCLQVPPSLNGTVERLSLIAAPEMRPPTPLRARAPGPEVVWSPGGHQRPTLRLSETLLRFFNPVPQCLTFLEMLSEFRKQPLFSDVKKPPKMPPRTSPYKYDFSRRYQKRGQSGQRTRPPGTHGTRTCVG